MIERSSQFTNATELESILIDSTTEEEVMEMGTWCGMKKPELGACNIPSQPFTPEMSNETSLVCGTVFKDLVMPYEAGWHLYKKTEEVGTV
ncbi:MAG: spore coat associated protein CotJA [Bacillota bacterium]